jgi:hypothetical protein
MQRGFTKLFNTIVTSTIWQEADATRIVWITMLAIADANGVVSASIPGLASVANVSVDAAREAIKTLLAPDEDSRTKDFDGRRIEEIDGGWHILNYVKYRRMLNEEERKEYKAKWIADRRRLMSTPCRPASTLSTHAEAEADAEADKEEEEREALPVSKRKPKDQDEVILYATQIGVSKSDAVAFFDSQESGGWTRAGKPLRDWKAALRTWKANGWLASQKRKPSGARLDQPNKLDPSKIDVPDQFKAWATKTYPAKRDEIMKWRTWADVPSSLRGEWWRLEKAKLPIGELL